MARPPIPLNKPTLQPGLPALPSLDEVISSQGTNAPITEAQVLQAEDALLDALDSKIVPQKLKIQQENIGLGQRALKNVRETAQGLNQNTAKLKQSQQRISELQRTPRVIRRLLAPFDSSYSLKRAREEQALILTNREILRQNLDDQQQMLQLQNSINAARTNMLTILQETRTADISRNTTARLKAIEEMRELEKLMMERTRLGFEQRRLSIAERKEAREALAQRVASMSTAELSEAVQSGVAPKGTTLGMIQTEFAERRKKEINTHLLQLDAIQANREARNELLSTYTEDELMQMAEEQSDGTIRLAALNTTLTQKEFLEARNRSKKETTEALVFAAEEAEAKVEAEASLTRLLERTNRITQQGSSFGAPPLEVADSIVRADSIFENFYKNGLYDAAADKLIELENKTNAAIEKHLKDNFDGADLRITRNRIEGAPVTPDLATEFIQNVIFRPDATVLNPADEPYTDTWRAMSQRVIQMVQDMEGITIDENTSSDEAFTLITRAVKKNPQIIQQAIGQPDEQGLTAFSRFVASRNSQAIMLTHQNLVENNAIPNIPYQSIETVDPTTGHASATLYLLRLRERYNADLEAGLVKPEETIPYDQVFINALASRETTTLLTEMFNANNLSNLGYSLSVLLHGRNPLVNYGQFVNSMQGNYARRLQEKTLGDDRAALRRRKHELLNRFGTTGVSNPPSREEAKRLANELQQVIQMEEQLEDEALRRGFGAGLE